MAVLLRKRSTFILSGRTVACDTEGTGLSPWKGDRPFGFSFCNEEGETAYVDFPVDPKTRRVLYDKRPAEKRMLVDFFQDTRVRKVFWNAKYDVRMIRFGLGIDVQGTIEEGMFAAHSCNPSEPTFALKPWAKKYAQIDDDDQERLQKAVVHLRRKAKARGWKISPDVAADYWLCMYAAELLPDEPELAMEYRELCETYARLDGERTMLAWMFCSAKMDELEVRDVYDEEMRLWPAVMEMEDRGVCIHKETAAQQRAAYKAEHDQYLAKIMEVGEEARAAGVLDCRDAGVVTQVDRLKSGRIRRVRVHLEVADKEKWFKFSAVEGSYQIDEATMAVGDVIQVHEPFKQKVFNPGSDEQLAKVLYDYLCLEVPSNMYRKKKRKTAARPVDADTLLELSASSEIVDDILYWRAASKALDLIDAYDLGTDYDAVSNCHILHADFKQCGPRSGRFACQRPNIQQQATKSGGRAAKPIDTRAAFGPRPRHVWYTIDYSQLEVRIFADLSQEPELCRIIRSGQHIHKACADHVWGFKDGKATDACIKAGIQAMGYNYAGSQIDTQPQVECRKRFAGLTPEQAVVRWISEYDGSIVAAEEALGRKNTMNKGKLAIFTRLFGGGIPSIMNLMKCTREEARTFLDEYDEGLPGMTPWMKKTAQQAKRDGCCWTAFGRRIVLDDLDKAYRAVNYRVQGSAADLMKRGMRACYDYLKQERVRAWIIMTIHDELVFEFDIREPRMHHVAMLQKLMEDHGGVFSLPMETKVSVVRRKWSESKEVEWIKNLAV
jgi:DNA polymerase I-like protein with 3'-5' exonuclease and polymerase domains